MAAIDSGDRLTAACIFFMVSISPFWRTLVLYSGAANWGAMGRLVVVTLLLGWTLTGGGGISASRPLPDSTMTLGRADGGHWRRRTPEFLGFTLARV